MEYIKTYTLFAGVNGAGKSTLYNLERDKARLGIRLNSDELVKDISEDWSDVKVQLEAGKRLMELQRQAFAEGKSMNRETTLCGTNIIKSVRQAKELGYYIELNYVGVSSPEIAKERVAKRIALGGHGVSEATVERRFTSSSDGFVAVYPLCDKVKVYDNSADEPILITYSEKGKLVRTDVKCKWADELIKRL